MTNIERDRELIKRLGGPVKLARRLGYEGYGSRRVANWNARGIPSKVKLQHPEIFLVEEIVKAFQANQP